MIGDGTTRATLQLDGKSQLNHMCISEWVHSWVRSHSCIFLLLASWSANVHKLSPTFDQVKKLGKRPMIWEDSFDQGIRLPLGVARSLQKKRSVDPIDFWSSKFVQMLEFTFCSTFGAHNLVHSFLDTIFVEFSYFVQKACVNALIIFKTFSVGSS